MSQDTFNILIGATGSVASIKIPLLVNSILDYNKINGQQNCKVRVIVTGNAEHFFDKRELPAGVEVFADRDEWSSWQRMGDPVLHVELGKWAHLLVIAPLDANTLAKMAQGLCDNLLTCATRAWDVSKPLLFCPAMNTRMWEHPVTATHTATLRSWGYYEVPCVSKTLACGDTGLGAMAEVPTIVDAIKKWMSGK